MKVLLHFKCFKIDLVALILFLSVILVPKNISAQVTLENEIKITDLAMYFNGVKNQSSSNSSETTAYDYAYGRTLTPHGDCIKTYKQYVFLSWYRGGKNDRHVMLTRYNTETGTMKTIEFPHQHTGFNGNWWIGETHNTIALGISPINGTVHMVYDMHAYTNGGLFVNDYFRYSYSVNNAAELPDADFTLDKFVKDPLDGDYKHCTMDGVRNASKYDRFSYPQFFLNNQGELFLTARDGTSHDGAQAFIKYEANQNKWGNFKYFNALGAQAKGETHNWSIYGSIKYVNGKIRAGFQRRLNNGSDKFQYQNGVYYAYSDDPTGASQWKNHKGQNMTLPLVKAEEVLVYEPGDYVATTQRNMVSIVGGFDWTVTDNGDVHIISSVRDNENKVTKNIHSYKPNGASDFIISTDFSGAETLYTSGNNVFIIGLNSSGRPFVQKANGGTNAFTTIYEQTSGKQFLKGEVYISNGKLYYYLLEKTTSTGDTRPTYLQIIDLKIVETPQIFSINLYSPTNDQVFTEGDAVPFSALANAGDGNTITKVEFIVNDVVINQVTTAPYSINWTPPALGTYTFFAKAYNSANETISSTTNTFEVQAKDYTDLSGDIYRLKNVATGQYLESQSVSASPILMNNSGEGQYKEWTFVETTVNNVTFYNIDCQGSGILRFTGSTFSPAFSVLNASKAAPATDTDKIWTVHYNETDKTYRFEAGTSGRFLYQNVDGTVINNTFPDTDARSKWQVISTSQSLSVLNEDFLGASIKVYPNPAKEFFTIKLQNINDAKVEIYNILGKVVYKNATKNGVINVNSNDNLPTGVYLIKAIGDDNKVYRTKLVIK